MLRCIVLTAAAIIAIAPGVSAEEPRGANELRIGFVNTDTGSGAILGQHFRRGWLLGLEHQGWMKDGDRLGGVATRIFYGDDQLKPETGLRAAEKMLTADRVHIVAGFIWSNVLLAAQQMVFERKVLLVSVNSGSAALAGKQCNPLFVSTGFQADQNSEAMGELVQRDGIKSVYLMVPNFQAGKDQIKSFLLRYKGKIAGQTLFKLGEADFQADLAQVRGAKPEALFVFAPGAMGIAFMKQWASSGLAESVRLYPIWMIDYLTLPAIGATALGTVHTNHWDPDSAEPRNQRFVRAYLAKHGAMPSHFVAQAYDGAAAIAGAVAATGGRIDDAAALARAIRKGGLASVRGNLKYNVNGFLVQPHYRRAAVKDDSGKIVIRTLGKVFEQPDVYGPDCPEAGRI
jgi:branched-chain amino acid transport system substrate-binding protein